ncbi:aldo/keto reductase [Clostridium paraputrificum]|uniref:aldo/keto reductase n=1 Tax=Clostridium paraputrificum TaxID=29363 RepID=UPI00325B06C6
MQGHYNLLYREEEREMNPLCRDIGVALLPYSSLAAGRLKRDWESNSKRFKEDKVV